MGISINFFASYFDLIFKGCLIDFRWISISSFPSTYIYISYLFFETTIIHIPPLILAKRRLLHWPPTNNQPTTNKSDDINHREKGKRWKCIVLCLKDRKMMLRETLIMDTDRLWNDKFSINISARSNNKDFCKMSAYSATSVCNFKMILNIVSFLLFH